MSNSSGNISQRFLNYEPDVNESAIEESWEKMKYFLPQKKKRRVAMLFRFPGFAKILVLTGILGAAVVYLYRTALPLRELNKNSIIVIQKVNTDTSADQRRLTQGEVEPPPTSDAGKKNVDQVSGLEAPAGYAGNLEKPRDNEETADPPCQSCGTEGVSTTSNSLVAITNDEQNAADILVAVAGQEGSLARIAQIQSDEWTYLDLVQIHFPDIRPIDPATFFIEDMKRLDPGAPKQRKLVLGVGVGPVWEQTHMHFDNENKDFGKRNLSATVDILYWFTNRWNVNGRFGMSENKFNYVHDAFVGNKLVSKDFTGLSLASGASDTLYHYVAVNRETKISSKPSYFFGLGAGYEVLRKNRLSIDVLCQFSLKHSSYRFIAGNIESRDTLVYRSSQMSGGIDNEVAAERLEPEENFSHKQFVAGISAGLTFGYQLTERLSIAVNPFYLRQVSGNLSAHERSGFTLAQNNLFLNLALRLKVN